VTYRVRRPIFLVATMVLIAASAEAFYWLERGELWVGLYCIVCTVSLAQLFIGGSDSLYGHEDNRAFFECLKDLESDMWWNIRDVTAGALFFVYGFCLLILRMSWTDMIVYLMGGHTTDSWPMSLRDCGALFFVLKGRRIFKLSTLIRFGGSIT